MDLEMAVATAVIEVPVEEALAQRFTKDKGGGRYVRRFRSNDAWIFELGGLVGLETWMDSREQQGIGSEEEKKELSLIKGCIKYHTSRVRNKWINQWDEQAAIELQEAEQRRLKREELLAARAREQRVEIDPRDAIRARLEHVITQPVPPGYFTPVAKPHSRKVKGECGTRIGQKID